MFIANYRYVYQEVAFDKTDVNQHQRPDLRWNDFLGRDIDIGTFVTQLKARHMTLHGPILVFASVPHRAANDLPMGNERTTRSQVT
jgi:hypothetical protein